VKTGVKPGPEHFVHHIARILECVSVDSILKRRAIDNDMNLGGADLRDSFVASDNVFNTFI
jgi:hypothetical protein